MAPRNNDTNNDYKKKNFPVEDNEIADKDILPCLLHKKHKVVKLVMSQMQKIQEEGLICSTSGMDADGYYEEEERKRKGLRPAERLGSSADYSRTESGTSYETSKRTWIALFCYLLAYFLIIFLLIFLMVWISAGPLSNSVAHSPIPPNSFVRTDSLCSLEKKYLLRWSKSDRLE